MSKETREHLSSLMDGEISREASRFLVRRLGSDEALCATWARYHVVRDCLRNQDSGFNTEDLCARVNRVIAEEQVRPMASGRIGRLLRPVAGMAIAASVALVAVMAVQPANTPSADPASSLAESAQTFTSPQGLSSSVSSRAVSSQRMNSYLLRHYQAAGSGNGRGIVGFVPVLVTSEPFGVEPEERTDTTDSPEESAPTSDTP